MRVNKLTGMGVVGEDRQTGKSLGMALQYIGQALRSPGVKVLIEDHHGTMAANRDLFRKVEDLILDLGLQHFVRVARDLSIVYNLYEEQEAPEQVLYNGRMMRRLRGPQVHIDGELYVEA